MQEIRENIPLLSYENTSFRQGFELVSFFGSRRIAHGSVFRGEKSTPCVFPNQKTNAKGGREGRGGGATTLGIYAINAVSGMREVGVERRERERGRH